MPEDNVATAGENLKSDPAIEANNPATTGTQISGQKPMADESTLLEAAQLADSQTEQKQENPVESEGAPEHYEEFKAPSGTNLDPEVVTAYKEVAKELNLPQSKAQGVIDKLVPLLAKKQVDQVHATNKSWAEKTLADPVIGGTHWKQTQASAARALKEFRGPDGQISDPDVAELAAIAGNHPGLIKIMRHFGDALREDRGIGTHIAGGKRIFTPEDFYKGVN